MICLESFNMKKKDVKFINRSVNDYGQIQLWVDKKGNLITRNGAIPTFTEKAGKEVVLMVAEEHKRLLEALWSQQYLMTCA